MTDRPERKLYRLEVSAEWLNRAERDEAREYADDMEVEGLIEELRTAAYVDGTAHGDDEQHANDADLAEVRLRDALRTLTAERDRLEAEVDRERRKREGFEGGGALLAQELARYKRLVHELGMEGLKAENERLLDDIAHHYQPEMYALMELNERLREDAERLDWLSARGNFEVVEYVGGGTELQWLGYEHEAENLREAIDAARALEPETEG